MQRSKTATFITLTYNDDNIPDNNSVSKRDLQLFHKRLRKHRQTCPEWNDYPLRYIAVSEYGTTATRRPHYHIIAFNYPNNQTIEKIWNRGFITQTPLTEKRIRYTFKYLSKPNQVPIGRERNFQLTSQGIGSNYLTANVIEYHNRQIENCYISKPDGNTLSIPKYYKSKLYSEEKALKVTKYQQDRINTVQDTQIARLMSRYRITEKEALQKFELSKINTKFDPVLTHTTKL